MGCEDVLKELDLEHVPDARLALLVDQVLALSEVAVRVLSGQRLALRHLHFLAVQSQAGVLLGICGMCRSQRELLVGLA